MNRTMFNRWRLHTFRSHEGKHSFTDHLLVSGRDEYGHLDRPINAYRLWIHWRAGWRLAAEFRVEDGALGDYEMEVLLAVPFLFYGTFAVERAPRLVRWLGVEYRKGKSLDDLARTLGFDWDSDRLALAFWANSDKHWGGRYRYIDLTGALLGRWVMTERPLPHVIRQQLVTQEGEFSVRYAFAEVTRRRPRWPRSKQVWWRADVEAVDDTGRLVFEGYRTVEGGSAEEMTAAAHTWLTDRIDTCRAEYGDWRIPPRREVEQAKAERVG